MGQAIATIAGALLSSSAQSGEKASPISGQVAQGSGVSNAGDNKIDMKTPDVKNAAEPVGEGTTTAPSAKSENKVDWEQMAKVAEGLLNSGNSSSAPVTANNVAGNQSVANFR